MKISYEPYSLEVASPHNSCATREGALLKVEFDDGKVGLADCHPWPELGDLPLKEQLQAIDSGVMTPLIACAIECAKDEAAARAKGRSLLPSQPLPRSHFLVTDASVLTLKALESVIARGFTTVKVKVGRNPIAEAEWLSELFLYLPLILRLDFNEKLDPERLKIVFDAYSPLFHTIDFVEDPCPYNPKEWGSLQMDGWTLACDRQAPLAAGSPDSARVLIVKPAVVLKKEWMKWTQQKKIVTSYLGHPVGQVAAAHVALAIDPSCSHVHGLLSHHVYQPNPYSKQLSWEGPVFTAPSGVGCGFDLI